MPQKSQQRRLQRGCMHTGAHFPGRWTRWTKAVSGNKTFRESVSAKWKGRQQGCRGLRGVAGAERQAAGAKHWLGKCDRERKEERKLWLPRMSTLPPQKMGGQNISEEDMKTWLRPYSLKVWGGEGQRLDLSPGFANALTRVARDTP